MRKSRMLAMFTATGAVALLAGAWAATAGAAAACTYSSAAAKVSIALGGAGDTATIRRSGNAIQLNGANCGAATVTNTDLIRVDGTADGSQQVAVDLGGGDFGPGKTAEAVGTSEIEFEIDLNAGYGERITVTGGAGNDDVVFGTGGATLNADDDVDLQFAGLDNVSLAGNGGADTLSIGGDAATGSPLSQSADINGGDGADALTGARATDTLQGGNDNDVIHGGAGGDTLKGGSGDDQVYGEAGYDYLDGDLGNDALAGGQDADYFNYYDGGASPDGADTISGGASLNDYLYLQNRTNDVIVKLDGVANDGADTNADGVADEGDNIKPDVENVQTGSGGDVIDARFATARLFAHSFTAGFGNDKVYGGDEGDTLSAAQGNDTIDGGDGNDSLDAAAGSDQLTGGDNIYPGDDNDTVSGSGGDDYIDAGAASSGADSYAGGDGSDRVTYSGRTTNLYIAEDNKANDGTDSDGIVGGEEGDNVRADIERIDTGSGDDFINLAVGPANVQAADNTVYALGGDDTIRSGLGADYVDAGEGADKVTGGAGEDAVYGRGGADAFTMNDGFYDYVDGGAGDGINDTGSFDSIDEKVNFP